MVPYPVELQQNLNSLLSTADNSPLILKTILTLSAYLSYSEVCSVGLQAFQCPQMTDLQLSLINCLNTIMLLLT